MIPNSLVTTSTALTNFHYVSHEKGVHVTLVATSPITVVSLSKRDLNRIKLQSLTLADGFALQTIYQIYYVNKKIAESKNHLKMSFLALFQMSFLD